MTQSRSFRQLLLGMASGLALVGFQATVGIQAGWSADKITLKYGPFYRSLPVGDLREYATTGQPSAELDAFLSMVKDKDRQSLTKTLNMKFPFNVVAVDKLVKTPMADGLLKEISSATILPGGKEDIALRGALLIAASSKEGLGTLSMLESYPTPVLTVDLQRLLYLMKNSKSFKGLESMMGSMGGSMGGAMGK
ncbi:MAG: alpha/beta hydrolase [Thermosynechococcaceae cyanobacterium]